MPLYVPGSAGAIAVPGDAVDGDTIVYDGTEWDATPVAVISSSNPQALGAAAPGATGQVSDAGHVHPVGQLFITGYYYGNSVGPGFNNATPSNGEEFAVPIDVYPLANGSSPTVTRIGVYLTGTIGGSGSVIRLGIYVGSTGRPGTLILDAGTVSGTSNGWKEATISQVLAPGRYFLSVAAQGSPSPQPTWVGAYNDMAGPVASTAAFGTGSRGAWYRTGITGALTNWSSWGDAAFQPRIGIKV